MLSKTSDPAWDYIRWQDVYDRANHDLERRGLEACQEDTMCSQLKPIGKPCPACAERRKETE